MAIRNINPFHTLYATETIGSNNFVKLFSPYLVDQTSALFEPGHIILTGLKGSGKSMCLNLLDPDIRIAYANASDEFPVRKELRHFIGAGINLNTSGAGNFGQRIIDNENQITPIVFGDFVNYWVVSNILISVKKIIQHPKIADEIGVSIKSNALNKFAEILAKDDCWFGSLKGTINFESLQKNLSERITTYKSFINFNRDNLPKSILESKSFFGDPISATAKLLRETEVILPKVQIYIKIDQYEELISLAGEMTEFGKLFQQIIHKALSIRDSHVSYRIGTRRFAWPDELKVYGTTAFLEKDRDFKIIDIDKFLQRKENRRTWLFPKFAEEIFKKRVDLAEYKHEEKTKQNTDYLEKVFGKNLTPKEKALKYASSESRDKLIEVEDNWPNSWVNDLKEIVKSDPLSACLGEAWLRQKGKVDCPHSASPKNRFPWDKKIYWKKERTEQALMQIASKNQQRLFWSGKDDVIALSGGNILIFLSLCQHIWDVWLRDKKVKNDERFLPEIDPDIQNVGIFEASSYSFENISGLEGGKRKRFVEFLGNEIYRRMTNDKSMSYPGNNGFSLKINEVELNPKVNEFLRSCTDNGDLFEMSHTSKTKGERRRKWYLNPILSPYFKIPYIHTKEPMYLSLQTVENWLVNCRVLDEKNKKNVVSAKKEKVISDHRQNIILFPGAEK